MDEDPNVINAFMSSTWHQECKQTRLPQASKLSFIHTKTQERLMNITNILASRENYREQNYTAGILVITAQLSEREREMILMKNKG